MDSVQILDIIGTYACICAWDTAVHSSAALCIRYADCAQCGVTISLLHHHHVTQSSHSINAISLLHDITPRYRGSLRVFW
jgi:hypothetical protein